MVFWTRESEIDLETSKAEMPECKNPKCDNSPLVPMRYVAACKNGHMSDVDWWHWAHSSGTTGQCDKTKKNLEFLASSSGEASLRSLVIRCKTCGASRHLEDLQKPNASKMARQKCFGVQPWHGFNENCACNEPFKYLLRSETAVHFSNIETALDLDNIERESSELRDYLVREFANILASPPDLVLGIVRPKITEAFGEKYCDNEILDAIKHDPAGSNSIVKEKEPKLEEWKKLSEPTEGTSKVLIVKKTGWSSASNHLKKLIEDVLVVERLREVRAFVSFSRVEPISQINGEDGFEPIAPSGKRISEDTATWKPAIEVFGEGIFYKFSNKALSEWERKNKINIDKRLQKTFEKISAKENWMSNRFADIKNILPRFILVHTFSHALMRQLSFNSGYNLASIREKLYVFEDKAGILIYTAQGDSEGSLGGLVRQGQIDLCPSLIISALESVAWCSNDPICSEMPENGLDGLNRAACHACSIIPETSCSELNVLLDRNLLLNSRLGNDEFSGFFDGLFE